MFIGKFVLLGAACATALLSGCAFVNSSTDVSAADELLLDTITRSGAQEGPSSIPGNSFTSVIDWARVGGGVATLESSAVTLRHSPGSVSPNGSNSSGLNVFSATDAFSVEGSRNSTNFDLSRVTANVILGRYTESEGSGADFRGYAAYATTGFATDFDDVVRLGRTGSRVSYTGDAVIEVFDGFGRGDVATGNANITADFGANDITGSMVFRDGLDTTHGGPDLTNVTLDVTSGSFVGNTFSANVSGNASELGAASLGDFSTTGSLYGAGGLDIGGSFSTTAPQAGSGAGDLVLIGGFIATK